MAGSSFIACVEMVAFGLVLGEHTWAKAGPGIKINVCFKDCGGYIKTKGDGVLKNYPVSTPEYYSNCTWVITSKNLEDKIFLSVTYLDIPNRLQWMSASSCPGGFLRIYDGDNDLAPLRGDYCGKTIPPIVVSSGNAVTVKLGSLIVPFRGRFALHYSVLQTGCGGNLTSLSGKIASPNYPSAYPMESDCEWILAPSPGNKVSLTFESFSMEESDNCNEDYLEIREGSSSGKILGVYCGNNTPKDIHSLSLLFIRFHTDENGTAPGFVANYVYVHGVSWLAAKGEISSPLYPQSYTENGNFSWRITALDTHSYILFNVKVLAIESENCLDNYLKIYDGYDSSMPVLKTLCGANTEDIAFRSTSSEAYVEFVIDSVIMGNKFLLEWTQNTGDNTTMCSFKATRYIEPMQYLNITSPKKRTQSDCEWIFTTAPGYHLEFKIHDFNILYCSEYNLRLYSGKDGEDTWQPLSHQLCTDKDNQTFNATNLMKVVEHSSFWDVHVETGFNATITSACGGILTASSGVVELPTNTTNLNRHCDWLVKVRPGRKIKFHFELFNLGLKEDCKVVVLIRNGESKESPLMGRYCGSSKTPDTSGLITFGPALHVSFSNSYLNSGNFSFRLHYEEQNIECGFKSTLDIYRTSETITTPNYPDVPSPYTKCVWTIVAPPGELLLLNFTGRFDVSCDGESVVVKDGGSTDAPLLHAFCDAEHSPIITTNNAIYIEYVTNLAEPRNGFNATVSFHVCGGVLREDSGFLTWDGLPKSVSPCRWTLKTKYQYDWTVLNIFITELSLPRSKTPCDTRLVIQDESGFHNRTYCNGNETLDTITMNSPVILFYYGNNYYEPHKKLGFKIGYNHSYSWQRCGDVKMDSNGYIGYTETDYHHNSEMTCYWTIHAPAFDQRVTLEIIDLNITAPDSLRISDGMFIVLAELKSFNNSVKRIYKSSGDRMEIQLQLKSIPQTTRFKAKYTTDEPALCSWDMVGDSGVLTHENVNDTKFICNWKKKNAHNSTIILKINLDVNRTTTQNNQDSYFGCYIWTSLSIGFSGGHKMLCRSVNEYVVIAPGPFVTIMFQKLTENAKCRIEWRVEKKCGGKIVSMPNNSLSIRMPQISAKDSIDCAWWINLFSTHMIQFDTNGTFVQDCSSQYLKLYRGTLSKPTATFCQSSVPSTPLIVQYSNIVAYYHSEPGNQNTSVAMTIQDQLTNACGGNVMAFNGKYFTSPHYPLSYESNMECQWNIYTNDGEVVKLSFEGRFNIETTKNCSKDALLIYDYTNGNYVQKARLCGRDKPQFFTSSENKMKVILRTDDSVNGEGFKVKLGVLCGGVYKASNTTQYIMTPAYPDTIQVNKNCTYKITMDREDSSIYMDFVDFSSETNWPSSDDCDSSYLQINNEKHCAKSMTKPVAKLYENEIEIKFVASVIMLRFKAEFYLAQCGGHVNKSGTIISSQKETLKEYPNNMECDWKITAPTDKIIVLKFLSLNLESADMDFDSSCFDSVTIYDDLNEMKTLVELCGNHTISLPVVRSTGNNMLLKFQSDVSNSRDGFQAEVIFTKGPKEGCGGTLNLKGGQKIKLESPLSVAGEVLNCEWLIFAPEDYVVNFHFESINVKKCDASLQKNRTQSNKCSCDFIEIKDSEQYGALTIARYCGINPPPPLSSSGQVMLVHFNAKSDSTFKATLIAERGICGKRHFQDFASLQKIESPGYKSDTLSRGIHCTYVIGSSEVNYESWETRLFHLHFNTIDLDPKDKLFIINQDEVRKRNDSNLIVKQPFFNQYEGSYDFDNHSPHLMQLISGQMKPFDLYMEGVVTLKLITSSEGSVQHTGFSVDVATLKGDTCLNYTADQGRIKNKISESCDSLITTSPNRTISLYIQQFYESDFSEPVFIDVYDGTTKNDRLLHRFTDDTPVALASSGPNMLISAHMSPNVMAMPLIYDFYYVTTHNERVCGGDIINYEGTLASPLYPSPYRHNVQCEWTITTLADTKLVLHFPIIDLGPRSLCSEVYLQLVNRKGDVMATYCADDEPADFKSDDNTVTLRYKSTLNAQGTGWRAQFIGVVPDGDLEDYSLLDSD